LSEATFHSAGLDWDTRAGSGRERLALVRELLSIRRRHITPHLACARFGEAHAAHNGLLSANWQLGESAKLFLSANLSDHAIAAGPDATRGMPIWGDAGDAIEPWSVGWRLEAR
jgi:hypothetical protein